MHKVILKSSLFIFLLVAFNRIFWIWLPDGWENPSFYNKQRVFFEHYTSETNTLFFGSSRTFAQIDPALFDSLNATHGLETRSYMLASSSVYFNEMFLHLEQFFEDPRTQLDLKYVFIELDNSVCLGKPYLFTPRQSYYISPGFIGTFLQRVAAQDLTLSKTLDSAFDYIGSMIIDVLHFGYGNAKLDIVTSTDTRTDSIWIRGKGHYALSIRNPLHQKGVYLDRHNWLMSDTSVVAKAFQRIDSVCKMSATEHFNPLVYQKYLDLITHFAGQGVHVIIMLPLNRGIDGELMSLYNALPDDHKMNLCTLASQIPQLHRVDHWFDSGHINSDGVVHYTTAFADEVNRRLPSR